MLKLLCAVLLLSDFYSEFQVNAGYVNDYDQEVHYECGANQFISYVTSQHNNHHEDRKWEYFCRDVSTGAHLRNCRWHNDVNNWDQLLAFRCPGNQVITGVKSRHNNHREDRIFSFSCCDVEGRSQTDCRFTEYLNDWDSRMSFRVPFGFAIVGFISHHDNHHEDRRWKAQICRIST